MSLAVHDLRTPLATISGFARTIERAELPDPIDRYVQMMVTAGDQLAELLEDVGLAARIESGRWEPNVQDVDTHELAAAAAAQVEKSDADGDGAPVRVDRDAATTALRQLARCALRHGGVERVTLSAGPGTVAIAPIAPAAVPILQREEPKDLGAMIAARVVDALGGSVEIDGGRLLVRLPA